MDHTLDQTIAHLAAQRHGVFGVRDLDRIGFTAKQRRLRVASGRWVRLHDGVYRMAGAPTTWRGALRAACLAGHPHAVASHRSAAALWDLDGADRGAREILCHLLQVVQAHGLPEPVVQYTILDHGRFVARVDAAYPDLRVAIEYESLDWHTGKAALLRDSARRNAVVAAGWLPIAVTVEDLRTGGHAVCGAIRRTRALAA